jgi:hypothetical protein
MNTLLTALVLSFFIFTASDCKAQNQDVVLLATGNFTKTTTGTSDSGYRVYQSSRAAAGGGIGYEHWWKNNGVSALYSQTPTNSKLMSTTGQGKPDIWSLERYEWAILYKRKFYSSSRISPYVGSGGMGTILDGGKASGYDKQFGVAVTSGIDLRLTPRFAARSGVMLDFIKASTFSDKTYSAEQTIMVEPHLGLVWKF